jgi:hypothetical protein
MEFETDEVAQKNGTLVDIAYLSIVERDVVIDSPTELVAVAGDGRRGPSQEKRLEAAEFLTRVLRDGAYPVKDCYRCKTNPDGAPGGKCGHHAVTTVEKAGGGACPDCGGELLTVTGLKALAELEGISFGTVKRAGDKDALDTVSGRKGFGPGSMVYWRLPDGHPALVRDPAGNLPPTKLA